jgi:hypothetical protein
MTRLAKLFKILLDKFIFIVPKNCAMIFTALFDLHFDVQSSGKANTLKLKQVWRGVRVVDGDALEMRSRET